jgi:hypothetical protein
MTNSNDSVNPAGLPPLADLFTQYLQRQAMAQAAGFSVREAGAEVVPFEAVLAQPVDNRAAWLEAVAPVRYFSPKIDTHSWQVPADWPSLVAQQEATTGLAFALGNFPQSVRNLNPLLHEADLAKLRPVPLTPVSASAMLTWTDQQIRKESLPQLLLVLGVLRLARQFDRADDLVKRYDAGVTKEWRGAWENEQAALSWHRGEAEKAASLWQAQADSVPVLFNRGMAALFSNQPREARGWLNRAVVQIPEDSSWHHLGRLYLSLSEMREA